ncbi:MAG: CBS domain-containing protein [Steroidobacteraceae bacterium]
MLVREAYTANVHCCGPRTTAAEAARIMRHKHVGDLVVVDDPQEQGVPLGIVTDRDLTIEVLGKGLDPAATTVASLMRKPVVIAHASEDTSAVLERMRHHGVRRIPVVEREGEVVGILTLNDLLRLLVADASALLEIMRKGQQQEQQLHR